MEEKIDLLSKQLTEKKKEDEVTEFERIKREARDEAAKGVNVNVDVLHQKLILLESTAGKIGHKSKNEIAMILARFQANKAYPVFAASFVLQLLSSKEEETILDKEKKLLKQFGMSVPMQRPVLNDAVSMGAVFGPPLVSPYFQWPRPYGGPRPRFPPGRQGGLCFKCKMPGHVIRNCKN